MIGPRWIELEEQWCIWDRKTRTLVINMVHRAKVTKHDLECQGMTRDTTLLALSLLAAMGERNRPNSVCYCWDVATWEDFASAT